jgi:hypothetical protein
VPPDRIAAFVLDAARADRDPGFASTWVR